MPFKEKGLVSFKTVDGKLHEQVESETIITLTNKVTGKEYASDKEAEDDVNSPVTDTTQDDISRNVNVIVGPGALGGKTNI